MSQLDRAKRFLTNPLRHRYYAMTRRHDDGPKVLLNSYQKAGTFLLRQCLTLVPNMANYHDGVYVYAVAGRKGLRSRRRSLARMGGHTFVQAHLNHTAESAEIVTQLGLRHILIMRDPRDMVVSYIKFQMSRKWLPYHDYFHTLPDENARIQATICGDEVNTHLQPLRRQLHSYLTWQNEDVLMVRFEDLVGEMGGGDNTLQRDTVAQILAHVGVSSTPDLVESIASNVFNPHARTFRKGTIGGWRAHFSAENKTLVQQEINDVLLQLNYETESNWQ